MWQDIIMEEFPNRIRELRELRGLTLEDLAEKSGLSVSYVSRLESGKRNLSVKNLNIFARSLDVAPGELLVQSPEKRIRNVPLVSWVSAGRLWAAEAVQAGDVVRRISIADLPPGDWIGLQIEGDSMDRIAPPGSVVLINRADKHLVPGKYYVFGYDSGEATFKRYRSNPDRLQPYSTNPDHETIYPENGLQVIGRARRVITELE